MRYLIIISLAALLFACKRETVDSENLYAGIGPKDSISNTQPYDTFSISGLHRTIFQPRCATNGCHDGSFEPDYRTIQSTYNTLVYAPVVKKVNPFQFRVVPYDTGKSWLWRRVTTNDQVLGRMPLYSAPLSDKELNMIYRWIMDGCPDMLGNKPKPVNFEPELYGFAVYNGSQRYDSIREPQQIFGSVIVPPSTNLDIWIGVSDDSTAIWLLTNNTLKISRYSDDFSAASSYTATFQASPKIVKNYWGSPNIPFYFKATINTGLWNPGETLYLRYYTKDGHHSNLTEFPENGSVSYLKTFLSLKIKN